MGYWAIPPELAWLEWVAGAEITRIDPDDVVKVSAVLREIAEEILSEAIAEADVAAAAVVHAYPQGEGGQQIVDSLRSMIHDDTPKGGTPQHGSIELMGNSFNDLAVSVDDFAGAVHANHLNAIFSLSWLAAELALSFFAGPGAGAVQAGAIAATRAVFRAMARWLEGRIAAMLARTFLSDAAKQVVSKLVYEIVQEAIVEVFQGTAQEVAVQGIVIAEGLNSQGWDTGAIWENAWVSALAGGAGGGAGFGLNRAMGRIAPSLMNNRGVRGFTGGAIVGAGAGLAGAFVAAWATGNWDPRSFVGGAISGAGPSGVYGARGQTQHNGPMNFNREPVRVGTLPGSGPAADGTSPVPAPNAVDGTGTNGGGANGGGTNGAGTTGAGTNGSGANANGGSDAGSPSTTAASSGPSGSADTGQYGGTAGTADTGAGSSGEAAGDSAASQQSAAPAGQNATNSAADEGSSNSSTGDSAAQNGGAPAAGAHSVAPNGDSGQVGADSGQAGGGSAQAGADSGAHAGHSATAAADSAAPEGSSAASEHRVADGSTPGTSAAGVTDSGTPLSGTGATGAAVGGASPAQALGAAAVNAGPVGAGMGGAPTGAAAPGAAVSGSTPAVAGSAASSVAPGASSPASASPFSSAAPAQQSGSAAGSSASRPVGAQGGAAVLDGTTRAVPPDGAGAVSTGDSSSRANAGSARAVDVPGGLSDQAGPVQARIADSEAPQARSRAEDAAAASDQRQVQVDPADLASPDSATTRPDGEADYSNRGADSDSAADSNGRSDSDAGADSRAGTDSTARQPDTDDRSDQDGALAVDPAAAALALSPPPPAPPSRPASSGSRPATDGDRAALAPDTSSNTDPASRPDPDRDPDPDLDPDLDPDARTSDPDADTDPAANPDADAGPAANPDADAGPADPDADTDPAANPDADAGPADPDADTDPAANPDADTGPAADPDVDTGPDPHADADTDPAAAPDSDADTGTRDPRRVLPEDSSEATRAEIDEADAILNRMEPGLRAQDLLLGDSDANPATDEVAAARADENARRWNALTDAERAALIRAYPDVIGNAPGIYSHSADTANRLRIARDLADLSARDTLDRQERQRLRELRRTVADLRRAQVRAARIDPNLPVRVLAYDPDAFGGKGRALVAFGNPDAATQVSVHVPGRDAGVADLGAVLEETAASHAAAAGRLRAGDSLASIAWLGYNTPGRASAMVNWRAKKAAELLRRDLAIFDATRAVTGNKPAVRIIAEGYGVDVAAAAGRKGGLSGLVGDIALVGTPGDPILPSKHFGDGVRVFVPHETNGLHQRWNAPDPEGARPPAGVPVDAMYRVSDIESGQAGTAPHQPDIGPAQPNSPRPELTGGGCGVQALWKAAEVTGNPAITVPAPDSVGPEGMDWRDIERNADAQLTPLWRRGRLASLNLLGTGRRRTGQHAIADALRYMRGRSAVIVINQQRGSVPDGQPGAHAFTMYWDADAEKVMVYDPLRQPDPFEFDPTDVPNAKATWGIFYDKNGIATRPLGDRRGPGLAAGSGARNDDLDRRMPPRVGTSDPADPMAALRRHLDESRTPERQSPDPLTDPERAYLDELSGSLGLGDSLSDNSDPLRALADLARRAAPSPQMASDPGLRPDLAPPPPDMFVPQPLSPEMAQAWLLRQMNVPLDASLEARLTEAIAEQRVRTLLRAGAIEALARATQSPIDSADLDLSAAELAHWTGALEVPAVDLATDRGVADTLARLRAEARELAATIAQLAEAPPQRDDADAAGRSPESVSHAAAERNRGRCAELSLRLIKALTGSSVIRLPSEAVGLGGMTASEVQDAAGGQLRQFADHEAIRRQLLDMPEGSTALVVDEYAAPVDEYGVGAHAYVLRHESDPDGADGIVMVRDPGADHTKRFPPTVSREVRGTYAILLDPQGNPVHPIGSDSDASPAADLAVRIGRSLDSHSDQVRALLRGTETGAEVLRVLDDASVRVRYERAAADWRSGGFAAESLTATVYTGRNDHVRQALSLAHESVHAERYIRGESGHLGMDRATFIRTMIAEEAAAVAQWIRVAGQFRADPQLGDYFGDRHYLEDTYDAAYAAQPRLGEDGTPLSEAEFARRAHERATEALIAEIETHVWPNGRNYSDYYGAEWDRSRTDHGQFYDAEIAPQPAQPAAAALRIAAADRARAHRELVEVSDEINSGTARYGIRPHLTADSVAREIADRLGPVRDEMADPATTPERLADLRRTEHDLLSLADLIPRRENAQVAYDRQVDVLTALAAREVLATYAPDARPLGDHYVHLPGSPNRIVIAGEPYQHQALRDAAAADPRVRKLLRGGPIEFEHLSLGIDDFGQVRARRVDAIDPRVFESSGPVVAESDLAGDATRQRLEPILAALPDSAVGAWALETLRRHGVTIEHSSDGVTRFYPARQVLVIDAGATDGEHMRALVSGAIHAEFAGRQDAAVDARDRMRSELTDYVDRKIDEETSARIWEIVAAVQLGGAVELTAVDHVYLDAYRAAREAAANEIGGPAAELDRIANQAGFDALRPYVAAHRPTGSDTTNAEFYERAWRESHGEVAAPDQSSTPPSGNPEFRHDADPQAETTGTLGESWMVRPVLGRVKRWLPFGRKASAGVESALIRAEWDGTEADGRPDRRGPAGYEAPEFPMEPNAAGGQGKPPNKPPVPAPSPDEPNEGERRPAARREYLFEFEGLTFHLDLTADGAGPWNPVLRQENSPAQESETAPKATNPKEVETPHAAQKPPGSIDKPKSKFLANTAYRRGFQGYNPKYPSGSSVDGAGQSVLGYSAGLPLTKDSPQGEVLQIKFNPARVLKEGVTMWKAREYVPILNRLTSRVPDRAAEFQPIRDMDGTEYRPWVDDASPEAVRNEHGVDIDEMRRRDDAAQQANSPASQEVRNELPQLPSAGAEATGAFADLLNELAGAVDQRRELADRLVAAARAMGLRLDPGLDGDAALHAVRVLRYQQARRIGALAGLAESAVRYDVENRHIPFSQEVSFFDNDPMTRFLREIVHADDRPTTMLDWQGVNNGGEPGRDWGDLSYTDQPGIDQGKPGYFVNALRRDQIKDERAVWAQLLQVDLHYLDSHPRGALADALANVHARTADIARFAELASEFVRADGDADELTRLVTDLALRSSIVADGGILIPDADGLGLLPGNDGGPLRLMVVDGHLDHAHVLASALRAHPNIAEVVNDGQVDVVFRVAEIATDGTILVSDSEPMRVRHVDELVDGRRLDMTFLLGEDGRWRPVVETAPTTEGESARPKPDLERLSRNEIESARKELAHRLGVPESDLDDPRSLSDRMEQIRAENKIRASQIEALIDYGRTAWDIDDFHTIGDSRAQLADRLKLEPGELTPERLAKAFVLDKIGSARRHQAVEDLVEYAALMRGIDADVVDAARDRLADRLGVGRRRGRFPRDLFPRNYNNDEKKYRPDRTGTDPKRLNKAIAKLARRPAERENLIDALAEYYRTINRLDPFDPVSRGADAVDPRLADVEFPVHPKAVAHLLNMIGDLESLADALRGARVLDGFGMLGANNSAPDPRPTPNPDFTRTVGVDLPEPIQPTDTDAEKAAKAKRFEKVYEIYRDGKIDQKERLTPRQLAKVQAELRAEVHGRAADLDMLAALNDRAAELDRQARRPLEIARLLGERGAAVAQLDTARADVEAATAHYRTAEPQERAAALDDLAAAARRQQAAAAELTRVDAALAATRPAEPPALPPAAHGAVASQGEGSSAPTRPEPSADGGGRKPPRGPLVPPTPDPEEPGRRPDVEIARRVTQRLAAENAAAVRELAAADAARNAAMVGLPVTPDQLGPAPEQVANTVDRLTRAHPEQTARIAELREAALRYLAAESEVAVLDEALARAMQREALAEEGAGRIDDTVGVVAGEPPRIVVVGWHSPGDVRAQLETERPLLRPLLARPGVVVTHIEIAVLDDGRITHRRTDFTPDRAPVPEPRDAGERLSPRQRAEERYQRALRDAHRQIGHPPQGDPRTTVWPGGARPEASSDPVAGNDDSTVDLGRDDPRTTVWPGGESSGSVADADDPTVDLGRRVDPRTTVWPGGSGSSGPVADADDPTVDLGRREDPRTRVWPGGSQSDQASAGSVADSDEPTVDLVRREDPRTRVWPGGGQSGNDPSGGSDAAASQPEPYRPKHRGRPADEAQRQAETYEPKHRVRSADESATEPDAHQPKHRGLPADESRPQPYEPRHRAPQSEEAQSPPDPSEGTGRHRGAPADESGTQEQEYEPKHRATQPDATESDGAQPWMPDSSAGTGKHRGQPADESGAEPGGYQPKHRARPAEESQVGPEAYEPRHRGEPADESGTHEQDYEPKHRASQPDATESEGAQPGMLGSSEGTGRHRGAPADESRAQEQGYEPKHRVSQPGVAESDGAPPGMADSSAGTGKHRGQPADESGAEPGGYQPKHRASQPDATESEGAQSRPPESSEGSGRHRGAPADESGVQPEGTGGQLSAGEPEADPMPTEAREALDRLRAERAEVVARRAEWDDIRRMRAEALDPADAPTVDALARAARQFDDAGAAVAELDAEIAELELANTPEGVYRQLMRERAVLAREREFWRAKRDDRYSRFSDLPLPFGDAAQALNQSNLARTLEHLEASVAGTRNIAGTGDEAGYVAREELDPGEIARRREQIFKLHDAALRYNRVQAALAEVDRRIAALGRVGIGEPQPLSRQVRAEVDRLAGERAREVLESKPWRQMRADIAARLRVNESDLGPDAAALDSALEEVAGRTVRADQLAERVRNLDLLREAATRVNEADHRIARIQGRIAELAGAGRDFLAAEGARQVTDRVGFVDGDRQRIIVIAPRGTLDAPRADHDAALLDAIQRDSRVARAMLSRETTIEYRELVAELDQPVTTRRLRSPSREYMTLGPEDAPVLRRVRWQSGERDSSTWHEVNPERPEWTTNRKGPTTPKEFKERDLPEGVSGWATNPFQAAVVDPFVDNGSGINKGLLPAIPGGAPTYPGPTYELPFADVFYHFMRLTLEPAKLFGFTWYNDSAHPGRISPGFKGHPWFRKKGADVQPMAREPERAEREHAPGELAGYERKQADEQRAWRRVQDWATEQYRLFRKSDGDIDRITANLAARPELEGAAREVRAAEIVDRIASVVEDYMSARSEVTTRTSDDPGPDLSAVVADLTGTLRSEQPGDAARLVDDIREALLGLKPDRAAISAEVAVRLDNSVKAFSREQIAQIKHHYMEAVYRRALPVDGSPARVRLDEVADVAEAWLRLIGDAARPEDVLMLQDALAESNFLRANDYASWRDANQYAVRIGFDWDSVRPPLTGWREGIRYAPAPLPTDAPLPPRPDTDDDGPDPLPPGPDSGPSSPPSLPPGQSPGQLPQAPSPDDVATVRLGGPIGADDPTIPLPGPSGADDPTVSLSGPDGADDPTVPLAGSSGADDPTVPLSGAIGADDPTVPLPNPESAEERGTNQDPTTTIGDDPTIDLRRGAAGSEQDGRPENAGDRYEIDNPQFGARLRYGFENWDAVVDALAPHERAVLKRIASLNADGSGFRAAIDAALRGDAELTPELAEAVDILDDVLTRFRLPDTAVMTYVRPENPLDMSGDVIESLHQLTEFPQLALGETPPIYGGRFHLELTVPAGTPALFMNRFLPPGMPVPVMMLGRGLHMRVDTVRSLGNDGHWLIRATVVPEADAPAEAAGDRSPGNAPVSSSAPESAVHQPDSRTADEVVSRPEPDAGGGGKKPPQAPPLTAPEPNDPADEGAAGSESQPPQPPQPPVPPESPVSPQPPRLPGPPELPDLPTAPQFPPGSGWPTSPGDPALPVPPTRPGGPPVPGVPTLPDSPPGWVPSPGDRSVPGVPTLSDPSPGWAPPSGEPGVPTLPDPPSVGEPGGRGLSGGANGYSHAAPMMPPPVPPTPTGRSRSSRAFPRAGFGNGRGPAEGGQRAATGLVVRSHAGVGEFTDFDPRSGALRGGASGGGSVSGLYGLVGDLSVVFYREAGRLLLRAGDRVIDLDAQPIAVYWQRVDDRTNRFVLVDSGVVACDVHYRAVVPDLDFGLLIRDVLCDPDRRSRIFAA
ncbi:alpha/beta hydrolase [Nocardia amikacinitolerans]|uniref:alpha/beta hydrolase n=1 Tax=Nocardia amikacinitolerans TaxID=756689 RepID=UPI0020A50408|nr:alpha/beta hydrolase [Nocardia amikacinitolerans]MCP2289333.1 Autotransporter adhesin [Nocardia amikacinitolerans]